MATAARAATDKLCQAVLPGTIPLDDQKRSITTADLMALRDIGSAFDTRGLLGVSPDQRSAAFILNRADVSTNSYCQALVVVALKPGSVPLVLDTGGEFIFSVGNLRGMAVRTGTRALNPPKWSPDGALIAYLKRNGGTTQAWIARADGSGARQATKSGTDIEAVGWTSDGKRLLVATRPDAPTDLQSRRDEARGGFLYDQRFMPGYENGPLGKGELPFVVRAVDLVKGDVESSTETLAESEINPDFDASGALVAVAGNGRRTWLIRKSSGEMGGVLELWANGANGKTFKCEAAACTVNPLFGFAGLWWDSRGQTVIFERREGPGEALTSFYRWKPGGRAPQRILITEDQVVGCVAANKGLLCAREGSTRPRYLGVMDVMNGKFQEIFDPNPEFENLTLGHVQRLYWKNDIGLDAYGDLVLPPDYRGKEALPLVVVQYKTKGFLRGGTGDDVPIQVLADRGYAVLSFNRPLPLVKMMSNPADMAEPKSVQSALENGIKIVLDKGIIDRKRIGITGHSNGSGITRFALINSGLFSAASMSSCCFEGRTMMIYGGPAAAAERNSGPQKLTVDGDLSAITPNYLAMNAKDVTTPILLQLADREALYAYEAFTALRQHGKSVEMEIFEDEYHNKWQPAHKLAIYNRNIDWFDFWLRDHEDADPERLAQYARWREMRASLQRSASAKH